jgi:hypothetical protein
MPDLKWTVRVDRWTWVYAFSHTGAVSWKDPVSGMSGRGSWRIERGKLITRWVGSKTWEEWDVPINPRAATGRCHKQEGTFDLRAEAQNFIEIETEVIFTRTKETKEAFIGGCNRAVGKVQIAQLQFGAWLSGIASAYGAAFEAHNQFLKDIDTTAKIAQDMLLGLALAFLGGGAGGVVAGAMKKLQSSDFAIDGAKDVAKFAVRSPIGAVVRPPRLRVMPLDPSQWQNAINERVMNEMAVIAKQIDAWRTAVESDDDTFDAGFDPAQVVENALVLRVPDTVQIANLPAVDKDALQVDFEKGWLAGWIALEQVSHIPTVRDLTRDKCLAYGRKLGLANIEELLNKHCPSEAGFQPATFTQ